MATPFETARRLLVALEDLVMQETLLIRSMDLAGAAEVQERAAPLVEQLCVLAEHASVQPLRLRVMKLIERRSQTQHYLGGEVQRLRGELDGLNAARGRVRTVAPAYRTVPAMGESRLNTAA